MKLLITVKPRGLEPFEVLELAAGVVIWGGLAVAGWWLFGEGEAEIWRTFAGTGIAAHVGGWAIGSRPLRRRGR